MRRSSWVRAREGHDRKESPEAGNESGILANETQRMRNESSKNSTIKGTYAIRLRVLRFGGEESPSSQDGLVDSARSQALSDELDAVADLYRCDYLDRLGKDRSPNDVVWFQFHGFLIQIRFLGTATSPSRLSRPRRCGCPAYDDLSGDVFEPKRHGSLSLEINQSAARVFASPSVAVGA